MKSIKPTLEEVLLAKEICYPRVPLAEPEVATKLMVEKGVSAAAAQYVVEAAAHHATKVADPPWDELGIHGVLNDLRIELQGDEA